MRKKIWVDRLFGFIERRAVFSALRLIDHDGKEGLSDINVFWDRKAMVYLDVRSRRHQASSSDEENWFPSPEKIQNKLGAILESAQTIWSQMESAM